MGSIHRRSRLSHDQIISAAASCFYEHGYAQTTLSHVARRLDVTDKAIYYYFSGKDALYLETLMGSARRLLALVENIAAGGGSGLDKVKAFARAVLRHSVDLRLYLRGLPGHLERTEMGQRVRACERVIDEAVTGWISDGIGDGSIRPGNPAMLWRWSQGALIWSDVWSKRDPVPDPRRLEAEIMTMLDRSLGGEAESENRGGPAP